MESIKKILNFYVFSNIHVALASVSLVYISFWNFGLHPPTKYLIFTFLSTFTAYHLVQILDSFFYQTHDKNFIQFVSNFKFFLFFLGISGMFSYIILFKIQELKVLIPVFFLTICYAVPFVKINQKKLNLRRFPSLKIFVVVLVWVLFTVWFPLQNKVFESQFWIEFIQRFALLAALVIPFDIRDYEIDSSDMSSLPQRLGVEQAKKVGILLLLVFFIMIFFKINLSSVEILSELMIFIIGILFIYYTKIKQSIYYTAFWIESIPIFWLLMLVGFRYVLG